MTWNELEEALPSSQVSARTTDSALNSKRPSSTGLILFRERNGWCPYSERVWLAFELKALRYDTVLIDNMGRRPSWFGGQTPQVQWQKGDTQSESMDIVRELEDRYTESGQSLFPWKTEVTDAIKAFREIFPKRTRPSSRAAFLFDQSGPLWRSVFEATLDGTDEFLSRHDGPFFAGEELSAADCAWAPFLERYAAQLPCLHDGLKPYDPARWPHLAAWYEAMSQVPAYIGRVCGDAVSWRKVLAQAGYGNAGVAPDLVASEDEEEALQLGASGLDESRSQELWSAYVALKGGEQLAATPHEEVAALIVKNRQALVRDASRQASLSEKDAEAGLQGVASLLQSSPASECDISVAEGSTAAIAAYLDDRLCVPRDMGVLPGLEVRKLARQFQKSFVG